jgi:hypothetical protein
MNVLNTSFLGKEEMFNFSRYFSNDMIVIAEKIIEVIVDTPRSGIFNRKDGEGIVVDTFSNFGKGGITDNVFCGKMELLSDLSGS